MIIAYLSKFVNSWRLNGLLNQKQLFLAGFRFVAKSDLALVNSDATEFDSGAGDGNRTHVV
jgi:hypothetical protein